MQSLSHPKTHLQPLQKPLSMKMEQWGSARTEDEAMLDSPATGDEQMWDLVFNIRAAGITRKRSSARPDSL
ncbi:MAG: hypothetical protein OXC07_09345 [Kistimonas sp.]|nr:hypothetical protein [Kistimonas sp.]